MRVIGLLLLTCAHALKVEQGSALDRAQKIWAQEAAKKNVENGSPVFYAVVMGQLAYRHQVSTWLMSLRKLGKWTKEAVIVTDKPVCLAATLKQWDVIGEKISSTDEVDIYGPGEGIMGNTHIVKRPFANTINKMKLEKSRAFDNLKQAAIPHPVSSIIYSDEDIVVGKDVNYFADGVVRHLENHNDKFTLAVFRDNGVSAGQLHTGIVVIFNQPYSDKCIQAWGKKLSHIPSPAAHGHLSAPKADTKSSNKKSSNKKKPHKFVEKSDEQLDAEESEQESEQEQEVESDEWQFESHMEDAEFVKQQLEEAMMGPDQKALGFTKECFKSAKDTSHGGIAVLPKDGLWFPEPNGMKKLQRAEFIHFTNTGRWKMLNQDDIRAYLVNIGLPEGLDPMAVREDKTCAIPEGGKITDVPKDPTQYRMPKWAPDVPAWRR